LSVKDGFIWIFSKHLIGSGQWALIFFPIHEVANHNSHLLTSLKGAAYTVYTRPFKSVGLERFFNVFERSLLYSPLNTTTTKQ